MRTDLPTGVVTLLFTDIEGSTRLLSELRSGYIEALAEHRRAIREAVAAHGGVEVDSQGDAFLIAFSRPTGAVAAALAAQRALRDGPVKVRMGLHTGEPELTAEGYVGLDVHRGARIGHAGHGGQILLSSTTKALVDIETIDLGEHRLDGIARVEHLYGVLVDDLPREFPPLRAEDAGKPELPTWLTSFIGREVELARIEERLDDDQTRLLTLVGPGGAGKTRLASEAAMRRWQAHGGQVTFTSAIAAQDADGLGTLIATSLGFAVDAAHGYGRDAREQLVDFLNMRPRLLLVDNVEHVDGADGLFAFIAAEAPETTLLATSRRRLGLTGEWVLDVGGLHQGASSGDALETTEPATRLFLERARQATPALTVSDDDWPHIQRICDLLDGMPLGIELAAAWMGTLSPSELAAEMERSFDLLESQAADLPARHRSLRAAFDGSWRLLDDELREPFASLSVFVGSFERDMAQEVAGADLRTLASLVSRSLVRHRRDGRYEVHELLRQYAAEELTALGRDDERRERHARVFCEHLLTETERLHSPAAIETRERLGLDNGNFRAALEWAVAHWPQRDIEPLLLTASALWTMSVDPVSVEIWNALSKAAHESRPAVLDADEAVTTEHIIAPHLAFSLAIVDDNDAADRLAEATLPIAQAGGRIQDVAMCRMVLGIDLCNRFADAEAIAPLEAADADLRGPETRLMRGELLTWLGWARLMTDDVEGAREAFETAYAVCAEIGEPLALAFCESKLGLLEDSSGNYEAALQRHLAAFAKFDAAHNRGGVGYSLSRASLTAACLGQRQAALDFAQAGYAGFADINHSWGLIVVTARLGYAYLGLERPADAIRWGLHSLELARTSDRLGRLHALGVVAGAMARSGDPEGVHLLHAILADPDMPGLFAIQVRAELEHAEGAELGGSAGEQEPVDIDATIERLLSQPHPAPVLP